MRGRTMRRPEFPSIEDLVVATVKRIEPFGAYVSLDEYGGKEGFLHISEISSTWVKNIRSHVREGQKVVLQVLRVDPAKGHIDLSLRRVTKDERRKKMEEWKKARKAEMLIKSAEGILKIGEEELGKAVSKVVEIYGSLYQGLEEASKRGVQALLDAGVSPDIAEVLAKIASEKIPARYVTISGTFEIVSMGPRGVEEIKSLLLEAEKMAGEDAEVLIYTQGAPRYKVEVKAEDYKKAEAILEKIVDYATSNWVGNERRISFTRG
ncbi:translation initiation factor IF-2 subunit alpha [Candidatus Bathyarchaeota archaeon]|nr:translation initiation factor IF-2 subunit alpha [Candidatus Bathyarchaeota archaeon]